MSTIFTHDIFGRTFIAEATHEGIYLTHPRWSLLGFGKDLISAEADMTEHANKIAECYGAIPIEDLSEDARAMLIFSEYLAARCALSPPTTLQTGGGKERA